MTPGACTARLHDRPPPVAPAVPNALGPGGAEIGAGGAPTPRRSAPPLSAPGWTPRCGPPGEPHAPRRATRPQGHRLERGVPSRGCGVAGGLGVETSRPGRDGVVMLGGGSWTMPGCEIATAVTPGVERVAGPLDDRGHGCVHRLQAGAGGRPFDDLLETARHAVPLETDFAAHARASGAPAEHVGSVAEPDEAVADPPPVAEAAGAGRDVAVPGACVRPQMRAAREGCEARVEARREAG